MKAIGYALIPVTIAHAVYAERRYAVELEDPLLAEGAIPYRREITGLIRQSSKLWSALMKIAIWQTEGFPGDINANLKALDNKASAAAKAGAEILLCPECWLCGYNIGDAAALLAEPYDGASAQHISAIARRYRLAIAYGYAERDALTNKIYNSVQVIGTDGVSLSNYRKTHLFGTAEKLAYTPGDRFEVPFSFCGFKIGLLICFDVEFPETVRSLALSGADVILIPTALTEEYACVPDFIVPARAVENQVYIAYCNHAGVENGMTFIGGSCITGMDGKALVSAGNSDALLITELSKKTQQLSSTLFPYRSDRRPELYGSVIKVD